MQLEATYPLYNVGVFAASGHLAVVHRYVEPPTELIPKLILCRLHPLLLIIALRAVKTKVSHLHNEKKQYKGCFTDT